MRFLGQSCSSMTIPVSTCPPQVKICTSRQCCRRCLCRIGDKFSYTTKKAQNTSAPFERIYFHPIDSDFLFALGNLQNKLLQLLFIRHFLDLSTNTPEFSIEVLISTLNIIDIIHNSDTLCCQSCDYKCCPCPQIRC